MANRTPSVSEDAEVVEANTIPSSRLTARVKNKVGAEDNHERIRKTSSMVDIIRSTRNGCGQKKKAKQPEIQTNKKGVSSSKAEEGEAQCKHEKNVAPFPWLNPEIRGGARTELLLKWVCQMTQVPASSQP